MVPTDFDSMNCQRGAGYLVSFKNSFLACGVDLSVRMMSQLCTRNQRLGWYLFYLSEKSVLPVCELIKMPEIFPYQPTIVPVLKKEDQIRRTKSGNNVVMIIPKVMEAAHFVNLPEF